MCIYFLAEITLDAFFLTNDARAAVVKVQDTYVYTYIHTHKLFFLRKWRQNATVRFFNNIGEYHGDF